MFCGLKGTTRTPRFANSRQSPATISDLPTCDPVPWIISAGTRTATLELDTLLRLHARAKWVLQHLHLGDEVGDLDQLVGSVASGNDDMHMIRPLRLQELEDLGNRQILIPEHNVQLVEHHHIMLAAN